VQLRRYWKVPIEEPIQYAEATEYVDHFRMLLKQAVSDRLRVNSAGVLMSGGLDSTAVAATAGQVLTERGGGYDLRAYTTVYDSIVPHEERKYAALAGQGLGIPIDFKPADKSRLYENWEPGEIHTPEPNHDPLAAFASNQLAEVSAHHRILFTGLGGDPVFSASLTGYLGDSLWHGRFLEFVQALSDYLRAEGRLSRLYLRTRWRVLRKRDYHSQFPVWLRQEFVDRLDLNSRWQHLTQPDKSEHPYRPEAWEALQRPSWAYTFEGFDAEVFGYPLEVCHPFFDVRLTRFLLRVPAVPWCSDKELLRLAMKGILPDGVRLRKKTPLSLDPVCALVRGGDVSWRDRPMPQEMLGAYVDFARIPPPEEWKDPSEVWINLRPYTLGLWMKSMNSTKPERNIALRSEAV
jgi:asparagine synthase (glutamine-hydrolysing)